jgi:hypothetical protein
MLDASSLGNYHLDWTSEERGEQPGSERVFFQHNVCLAQTTPLVQWWLGLALGTCVAARPPGSGELRGFLRTETDEDLLSTRLSCLKCFQDIGIIRDQPSVTGWA